MATRQADLLGQLITAKLMDLGRPTFGERWFVDSTHGSASDADTHGQTPALPFASIDFANDACSATRGDVIVAMPGHAETIAAAADIDLDTANVTLLGLGKGAKMPKLTLSGAAGGDVDLAGDGVCMAGMWVLNSENGASSPIDVDGANVQVENCIIEAEGANDWVTAMALAATAHRCSIKNNNFIGTATAGGTSDIAIAGACNNLEIVGNRFYGDCSAGNIVFTAAATRILIDRNWCSNLNAVDVCIEGFAAITGWISRNMLSIASDTILTAINTPGNARLYENYLTNAAGETGILAGTPSA